VRELVAFARRRDPRVLARARAELEEQHAREATRRARSAAAAAAAAPAPPQEVRPGTQMCVLHTASGGGRL
jgi:hypothetical protein